MTDLTSATRDYHAKHAKSVSLYLAWMDASLVLNRANTPYSRATSLAEERRAKEAYEQARAETIEAAVTLQSLKARIARAS